MKNKIALLAFLALPGMLMAQAAKFTFEGNTAGAKTPPAKVYLVYKDANAKLRVDTAQVVNGKYTFSGTVANSSKAVMYYDYKAMGYAFTKAQSNVDAAMLVLVDGAYTLNSPDSLKRAKISGPKLFEEWMELNAINLKYEPQAMAIINSKPTTQEEMRDANARLHTIMNACQKDLADFIRSHAQSTISLDALAAYIQSDDYDMKEADELYAAIAPEVRDSENGKVMRKLIDTRNSTRVGGIAPDFEMQAPDGKTVKLSDLRGQYVLVDFWASWCGPCRKENPHVVEAYNKFKKKKFTVLGVSLDDNRDKWVEAIEKDGLTWTHVSDLKGWKSSVVSLYNFKGIPYNVLLDPQGRILAKNLRGEALIKKLAEVIK